MIKRWLVLVAFLSAGLAAAAPASVSIAHKADRTIVPGFVGGSQPGVVFQAGVPATAGAIATLPVALEQSDTPGSGIIAFSACLDFDPLLLEFDMEDADGNGLPDAAHFLVTGEASASLVFDPNRADCELLFGIGSTAEPPEPLPEQVVVEIDFLVAATASPGTIALGCGDPAGLTFEAPGGMAVAGFCSPGFFVVAGDEEPCVATLTVGDGTGAPGTTGHPVVVEATANAALRAISFGISAGTSLTLAACEPLIEGFSCTIDEGSVTFETDEGASVPAGSAVSVLLLRFDVAAGAPEGEVPLALVEPLVLGADAEPCEVAGVAGSFLIADCTSAEDCDDAIACTVDTCDEVLGCTNAIQDLLCDDAIDCTADTCEPGATVCAEPTEDVICEGACVHRVDDGLCADEVACTLETCDPDSGGCVSLASDELCENGLFCDGAEQCVAGMGCEGGLPIDCDDGDSCTDDACDERGGACSNEFDASNEPACEVSDTAWFSISQMQFGFGMTLRPRDLLAHSPGTEGVELPFGTFLPMTADLDAADVVEPGRLLFSVRATIGVTHSGGYTVLRPERVYEFVQATGEIRAVPDWSAWGIGLASLDALDRLGDGTIVFSARQMQGVQHTGGYIVLRPANAYRFDPEDGSIELFFDGTALGFGTIDALDVGAEGRIALSFEENRLVQASNGTVSTRHQNVYVYDPADGSLHVELDAEDLGIHTLDAYSRLDPGEN